MRHSRLGSAVAVGALAFGLTACSRGSESSLPQPKPGFCEAAQHYDRRVERNASVAEQITILEKLERNAPKDVAKSATVFLDSMREYQAGDAATRKALKHDPDVQQAIEDVNRRAINGCGFFDSEPGDGN